MGYRLLADCVVIFHFCFIAFVLFGGVLVLRWPRLVWLHLPAITWGIVVEFFHLRCPLTPLENYFRYHGSVETYQGDFIDRYLSAIIYPRGLTANLQIAYGSLVLLVNLAVYSVAFKRWRRRLHAKPRAAWSPPVTTVPGE